MKVYLHPSYDIQETMYSLRRIPMLVTHLKFLDKDVLLGAQEDDPLSNASVSSKTPAGMYFRPADRPETRCGLV